MRLGFVDVPLNWRWSIARGSARAIAHPGSATAWLSGGEVGAAGDEGDVRAGTEDCNFHDDLPPVVLTWGTVFRERDSFKGRWVGGVIFISNT